MWILKDICLEFEEQGPVRGEKSFDDRAIHTCTWTAVHDKANAHMKGHKHPNLFFSFVYHRVIVFDLPLNSISILSIKKTRREETIGYDPIRSDR